MTANLKIEYLKEQQRKQLAHYRKQKRRYTADIDQAISEVLVQMFARGATTKQMQEALGSKDYATLRYYLDFEHPGKPQAPLALTNSAPPSPTSPTDPTSPTNPTNQYPRLKDYLTVDKENRKITLTNAPYEAFSQRTHDRPDLYELDPTNEKTYSGWAEITKTFGIGARSEDNSVFISENKEGGQLTRSVIEGLFA